MTKATKLKGTMGTIITDRWRGSASDFGRPDYDLGDGYGDPWDEWGDGYGCGDDGYGEGDEDGDGYGHNSRDMNPPSASRYSLYDRWNFFGL